MNLVEWRMVRGDLESLAASTYVEAESDRGKVINRRRQARRVSHRTVEFEKPSGDIPAGSLFVANAGRVVAFTQLHPPGVYMERVRLALEKRQYNIFNRLSDMFPFALRTFSAAIPASMMDDVLERIEGLYYIQPYWLTTPGTMVEIIDAAVEVGGWWAVQEDDEIKHLPVSELLANPLDELEQTSGTMNQGHLTIVPVKRTGVLEGYWRELRTSGEFLNHRFFPDGYKDVEMTEPQPIGTITGAFVWLMELPNGVMHSDDHPEADIILEAGSYLLMHRIPSRGAGD